MTNDIKQTSGVSLVHVPTVLPKYLEGKQKCNLHFFFAKIKLDQSCESTI